MAKAVIHRRIRQEAGGVRYMPQYAPLEPAVASSLAGARPVAKYFGTSLVLESIVTPGGTTSTLGDYGAEGSTGWRQASASANQRSP